MRRLFQYVQKCKTLEQKDSDSDKADQKTFTL